MICSIQSLDSMTSSDEAKSAKRFIMFYMRYRCLRSTPHCHLPFPLCIANPYTLINIFKKNTDYEVTQRDRITCSSEFDE